MPNLAALRAAVFKLFAKNRWGHNMPPSSARVKRPSNHVIGLACKLSYEYAVQISGTWFRALCIHIPIHQVIEISFSYHLIYDHFNFKIHSLWRSGVR